MMLSVCVCWTLQTPLRRGPTAILCASEVRYQPYSFLVVVVGFGATPRSALGLFLMVLREPYRCVRNQTPVGCVQASPLLRLPLQPQSARCMWSQHCPELHAFAPC